MGSILEGDFSFEYKEVVSNKAEDDEGLGFICDAVVNSDIISAPLLYEKPSLPVPFASCNLVLPYKSYLSIILFPSVD